MKLESDLDQLDRLIAIAESHVKLVLITYKQPDLVPLFHLVCPGSHDFAIATPFVEGDTSKDAAAAMIREKIRELGATAYMFVSEAWMIVRPAGYVFESPRPKDADDRIEVVIAIATDGVGYRMRRWRMKRDKQGKCVDLVRDADDDVPSRGGRFDNLFTKH